MSFTNLQKYPFVCWICLRPEDGKSMTSLDTEQECFGGTIRNYLATMTAPVDEDKRHLFPRSICSACRESLESFARFRTKVRTVHALMNGLVELRHANEEPIREVFRTNKPEVMELKLSSRGNDAKVEDLIGEFAGFEIALLPASLVNCFYVEKIEVKEEVGEDQMEDGKEGDLLFMVECLPKVFSDLSDESSFKGFEDEPEPMDEIDLFKSLCQLEFSNDDGLAIDEKPEPKKRKRRRKKDSDDVRVKQKESKLEEPLLCPKCPYKAFYAYRMKNHERSHEGKVYRCNRPNCEQTFPTNSAMIVHKEMKHNSLWICELCGKQFVYRSTYTAHKTRAHDDGELKFGCEYCQKRYKLIADLRIHVRNIHKPRKKVFKCETCGKEFLFNHLLEEHKLWHGDEYNFPCPQCDKKYKTKHALRKHTSRVHREPLYQCEHCTQPFADKGRLLDHIEHVHEIQMRFVCEVCLAVFDSQETLATHASRHRNPKLLECGLCLSIVSTQEELQDHLCITYREDYICCGRDQISYQQYNRHQLIKHGVKMNARVKPIPGVLLGRLRATRKRVETCPKCKAFFDTKKARDEHMKQCEDGGATVANGH